MTEAKRRSTRQPLSHAHARLGAALKGLRETAGIRTREIPGFSSGHVSNVETGCVTPSRDFIDTYIRLFGGRNELAALHEHVRVTADEKRIDGRRRSHSRSAPEPPQTLDEVASRDDVMRHLIVEAHEASCTFSAAGVIQELRSTVSIRAKTAGVRLFYAGHFYDADPRPGVLEPFAISGGSLAGTQESEMGAMKSYFSLDRTPTPDEPDPVVLSYAVRVHSDRRALPQLAFYSQPGTQRMILHSQFTPPSVPPAVWWFAAPNIVNLDRRQENELTPTGDGQYDRSFSPLVAGWCYGFSWNWAGTAN